MAAKVTALPSHPSDPALARWRQHHDARRYTVREETIFITAFRAGFDAATLSEDDMVLASIALRDRAQQLRGCDDMLALANKLDEQRGVTKEMREAQDRAIRTPNFSLFPGPRLATGLLDPDCDIKLHIPIGAAKAALTVGLRRVQARTLRELAALKRVDVAVVKGMGDSAMHTLTSLLGAAGLTWTP